MSATTQLGGPTSHYLTYEANAARMKKLRERIARERMQTGPGSHTYPPESDYWLLPPPERTKVDRTETPLE